MFLTIRIYRTDQRTRVRKKGLGARNREIYPIRPWASPALELLSFYFSKTEQLNETKGQFLDRQPRTVQEICQKRNARNQRPRPWGKIWHSYRPRLCLMTISRLFSWKYFVFLLQFVLKSIIMLNKLSQITLTYEDRLINLRMRYWRLTSLMPCQSLSLDWPSCKSFKAPYDVVNQDVHLSVDNDEQIFA